MSLECPLGQFSSLSSPSSFITISYDSRVSVWDVDSGFLRQHFCEKNHLEVRYSCLAIHSRPESSSEKSLELAKGLIALGTDTGSITVWNMQTGVLTKRLRAHTLKVRALAFTADGAYLFSCGEDKLVVQWALATGEIIKKWLGAKKALTALALSPQQDILLTASSNIKIWDLSSYNSRQSLDGHTSSVTRLAFSPDGKYCISGSGDRVVNLWNLQSAQGSGTTAVRSFPIDSYPIFLGFSPYQTQGYHMVAISCNSKAYIFEWHPFADSTIVPAKEGSLCIEAPYSDPTASSLPKVDSKSKRRVGLVTFKASRKTGSKTSDFGEGSLLSAAFCSSTQLLLVRHSSITPTFQTVRYLTSDGNLVSQIELPQFKTQYLIPGRDVDKSDPKGIESSRKNSRGHGGASEVLSRHVSSRADYVSNAPVYVPNTRARIGRSSKRQKTTGSIESTDVLNMPLGQRLATGPNEMTNANQSTDASKPVALPSTGSLQTVLTQALHTSDQQLLEYCIGHGSNPKVIHQTVKDLSAKSAQLFLATLVNKLQRQPTRATLMVAWIQELLLVHAPSMMDGDSGWETLWTLKNTVEARLGSFNKLLELSGRLNLVLSSVQALSESDKSETKEAQPSSMTQTLMAGPEVVFNDYSDEEEG
eukprot:g68064.t1